MDEYEALAISYANDTAGYKQLKDKLRRHKETYPLFITKKTLREIEALYLQCIEKEKTAQL